MRKEDGRRRGLGTLGCIYSFGFLRRYTCFYDVKSRLLQPVDEQPMTVYEDEIGSWSIDSCGFSLQANCCLDISSKDFWLQMLDGSTVFATAGRRCEFRIAADSFGWW